MSEGTNVMLRSLLFQMKTALQDGKSLKYLVKIVEGIAGEENVALVDKKMAEINNE